MKVKKTWNHIAKLVREARLGMSPIPSQSAVGRILGYKNGQFLSNVERALCGIPLDQITMLCDELNIDPVAAKEAMMKDMSDSIDLAFGDKLKTDSKQQTPEMAEAS